MPTTKARILAVCAAAMLALPALGACATYHDASVPDTYHDASAPHAALIAEAHSDDADR